MNPNRSRTEAAELMLQVSTTRMLEYAERYRQVMVLADRYGVDVGRIAEITELDVNDVRRILSEVSDF